ncbi:peptidoglycan-binding protein [Vagococcus sp. BWB3-3]|uniref:Peptidoglycan-binding protein n=1 Tax=Vagococcus allomyrinae TaxID=2794353 RepID=A0A940PGG0_9ENTE|nr:peptidoglycan-binding domain-containing protein [Vagococcus allomyrinae]MBP1042428.1 peptidoglycan-binding protein [Vagococcus allomyrinae]
MKKLKKLTIAALTLTVLATAGGFSPIAGGLFGATTVEAAYYNGYNVTTIQQRLNSYHNNANTRGCKSGYPTLKVDGIYGAGTRAAVKAFQARNGLTADGIYGKATHAKLSNSSKWSYVKW